MADALLIRLEGEFDISESDRLQKCFETAADAPILILDFEKTTYVDSSVLHVLCALQSTMDARAAKLILINLGKPLRRLFEIMRLDTLFDLRYEGDLAALGISRSVRTITSSPRW